METQQPEFNVDSDSLKTILRVLGEGAYTVDRDRRIVFWNQAAERLTGYRADDIVGRKCSDNLLRHVLADGTELCLHGCPLLATMEDGNSREAQVYLHHRDGHRLPVFVRSAPLRDNDGSIVGSLEIFSDRSDGNALLAELESLKREILTDPLTGLGNRRYLDIMSETRFAALKEEGLHFGLMLADIDHFKRVNDDYGHLNGDRILTMTAKTIAGAVGSLDAVVRFGGEEFVVLCPNCGGADLAKIAERICTLLRHAWIDIGPEEKLSVTVSIGGAISEREDDLKSLVARADKRMYECKKTGRDRYLIGD
ncbi:MAG: sensor domain-containing diguanylate cyclase [Spirochaetes bacterium]|nr:sensor domain-containing diguanylate cyclase [Spirochaetota bacterium]